MKKQGNVVETRQYFLNIIYPVGRLRARRSCSPIASRGENDGSLSDRYRLSH